MVSTAGVEAGGGLVHDDEQGLADEGLGVSPPKRCFMPPENALTLRLRPVKVDVRAGPSLVSRRSPRCTMPLHQAMWSSRSRRSSAGQL
jgi:hypothetical protein